MAAEVFLLALLIFWVLLYLAGRLFHLDKYGFEIYPAYLSYKSEKLKAFLDVLSERGGVVWRKLCDLGWVLAIGLMAYSVYFLADNVWKFAQPGGGGAPVIPVLFGITIRLYWLPYFMASAVIVVITHELAHGVAARLEKIPIKSAGVLLALVIPGGFVETDEERFEKASTLSKLRVLSAGSSTNLVTGLLVFLLSTTLYAPPSGILILGTLGGGPLEQEGLRRWDVIYAINGTEISTLQDLDTYFANVTVNDTLILETSKGNKTITVIQDPTEAESHGIIGLTDRWNYYPFRFGPRRLIPIQHHLHMTLDWILILAWGIALFNMLPIYPFDGDRCLYSLLEKVVKKRRREVRILFNSVCLGLMAANLMLTFMRYGLISI